MWLKKQRSFNRPLNHLIKDKKHFRLKWPRIIKWLIQSKDAA